MIDRKTEQEIKELLDQLQDQLDLYTNRLEKIGVERREILRLFARRLEQKEVEKMSQRIKTKVYGKDKS
ncbi:MAG: hypothetical protein ACOYUZ_05210 [Patescibacteria group bacterium]